MDINERFKFNRKRVVNAKVSPEEYERLRAEATAQGVPLACLIRKGIAGLIRPAQVSARSEEAKG